MIHIGSILAQHPTQPDHFAIVHLFHKTSGNPNVASAPKDEPHNAMGKMKKIKSALGKVKGGSKGKSTASLLNIAMPLVKDASK